MNAHERRCPTCGAVAGEQCVTVAGAGMGQLTHRSRKPWRKAR